MQNRYPLPSHVKTVNRRMKRFAADRWFDEKMVQLANGKLIVAPNHHEMCGLLSESQRESLMIQFKWLIRSLGRSLSLPHRNACPSHERHEPSFRCLRATPFNVLSHSVERTVNHIPQQIIHAHNALDPIHREHQEITMLAFIQSKTTLGARNTGV